MEPDAESILPFFSIVVPVRDGGAAFDRCLESLTRYGSRDHELIVVDDGSVDASGESARSAGARVIRCAAPRGPAAARNAGAAAASGRHLFFLDADCELHADTLSVARRFLEEHPEVGAVFGSYDDDPAAPGVVSRFKNLFHHWVHQRGAGPAESFWAGCGAVRRELFEEVGGFDEERFRQPSIEDIELGYRLRDAGVAIELLPEMLVKHWKKWRLLSLVRTDVLARAAPWTRLLLERRRGGRARELNLDLRTRASVGLTALALPLLCLVALDPRWGAAAALALLAVVALNLPLYVFFARQGPALAAAAVPLHLLHCGYSAVGAVLGGIEHWVGYRAGR
jgi:glycosyltransferase involved in cell wall biosynthesis